MIHGLVRAPAPSMDECELTWLERRPIDPDLMAQQHAAYVVALRELGVSVRVLDAAPLGLPDAPFVEDTAVILPEVTVIARSGSEARRAEVDLLLAELPRDRPRLRLPEGATLDGGDVLAVGREVLVGVGTRTNAAAFDFLRDAPELAHRRVRAVPVDGALHLKTALTAARADLLVVREGCVDSDRVRYEFPGGVRVIRVPESEPAGSNVLALPGLDPHSPVLVSASAPETAERLRAEGVVVRLVEVSEFEKAEAGLTCLSLLWKVDPGKSGTVPGGRRP